MKPIKTAGQLIAEIVEERAERARIEAEQDKKSEKMLATLYTELRRTEVAVAFNGPEIKLVADAGPDIIVERFGRLLCRISSRDGELVFNMFDPIAPGRGRPPAAAAHRAQAGPGQPVPKNDSVAPEADPDFSRGRCPVRALRPLRL
jgi:hypothetical protein